jgi:parvulin-like peptidyl-prolyl isomerase
MFKMPTRLKARHILVKTKREANQLISQLKNSKDLQKDFINLAKEKSIGPSGKNGGDLGWFTPEKMVPAFSNAAMNLSKGQITLTPVKTQFGYHIIYLEDKQNAKTVSFDNVKEQIKQRLASEKFNQTLKDIVQKEKEKAKIEYKF